MKSELTFMKVFLATLLAIFTNGMISGFMWFVIMMSFSALGTTNVAVAPNSILKIDLADNITDAPQANPFASFDFATMNAARNVTLLNVLGAIEAAETDDRIKGIYININNLSAPAVSSAGIEEIREAIAHFKQSGKFVVAYNDNYSQGGYYLASVADKIYLQPEGGFEWVGMASTSLFFKNAFDKLGVKCEAFRPSTCKYKSAVEPYIMNKMSEANRRQMTDLTKNIWQVVVEAVSEARGIDAATLNRYADNLSVTSAEEALACGFVDGLLYRDQMEGIFAELGVEKSALGEYEMVALGDYCSLVDADLSKIASPAIGVVYADGQIVDGDVEGTDGLIYGTTLANTIAKARKNEDIKAVVLRVNSPGGSALASDVIWREVELLKAEKPVIVSMGGYAASGGYYISAPADAIIADRLTLTGSIGVFGLLMEGGDLLKNKLGITTDGVKTNTSADMGSNIFGLHLRSVTPLERAKLIASVDKVYEAFVGKVAAGRNMPKEKVFEIAEGRVWSGVEAVKIGLADANGGLKSAIALAADKAGIANDFRVEVVAGELTPFVAFMKAIGAQARSVVIGEEFGSVSAEYEAIRQELTREGVQAYMPYRISF